MNDNDRELAELRRKKLEKMLEDVRKRGGDKTTTRIVVRRYRLGRKRSHLEPKSSTQHK